tara:strand:- start:7453 stop:8112 length:660 start_codon:yes stop_codon:yes gene_type:complete
MNILIFLGPAGSGKGTQAQFLTQKLGYFHVSTGDLLRKEVASKSDLGQQVESIINNGDLVSDDIIISIIKQTLNELVAKSDCHGVIFDGFPRTKDQAMALDELVHSFNFNLPSVIYFDLSLEESIQRISGRLIDSRNNNVYHKDSNPPPEDAMPFLMTREDDVPEKVTHRYGVYQRSTEPLLDFYDGRTTTLDCLQSIHTLNQLLIDNVDSMNQSLHSG